MARIINRFQSFKRKKKAYSVSHTCSEHRNSEKGYPAFMPHGWNQGTRQGNLSVRLFDLTIISYQAKTIKKKQQQHINPALQIGVANTVRADTRKE